MTKSRGAVSRSESYSEPHLNLLSSDDFQIIKPANEVPGSVLSNEQTARIEELDRVRRRSVASVAGGLTFIGANGVILWKTNMYPEFYTGMVGVGFGRAVTSVNNIRHTIKRHNEIIHSKPTSGGGGAQ